MDESEEKKEGHIRTGIKKRKKLEIRLKKKNQRGRKEKETRTGNERNQNFSPSCFNIAQHAAGFVAGGSEG